MLWGRRNEREQEGQGHLQENRAMLLREGLKEGAWLWQQEEVGAEGKAVREAVREGSPAVLPRLPSGCRQEG